MPEEPFKNREILEMFGDVKKTLTEIKEQTTKTNGRVTRLEKTALILITALVVMLGTSNPAIAHFLTAAGL